MNTHAGKNFFPKVEEDMFSFYGMSRGVLFD